MTTTTGRRYDFRLISLALIDPPTRAMREQMDPAALEALATNIKRNGVIHPLGVVPVGDRFRVSWGHRRLIAAGMVGETAVACRVLLTDDVREQEFTYIENTFRETVNPAEEATWLAGLLEHHYAGDLQALCIALNVRTSTVQGRLDLLRGDPEVMEAVRRNQIGLGVAREINKMNEPSWRHYRLGEAITQGATERVVREWRFSDAKHLALQRAAADGTIAASQPSTEAPLGTLDFCPLCELGDDQMDMTYIKVHRSCLKVQVRESAARARQTV